MVKLRWLKDYKDIKAGEIAEAGKESAENFVSQGYAEYFSNGVDLLEEIKKANEEQPVKKSNGVNLKEEIEKLEKKQEKKKLEVEQSTMSSSQINERLKLILDKSPIEQDEEVDKLVIESGKRKKLIQDQLKIFIEAEKKTIKEQEKDKKQLIKQAGFEFTEKQFYLLKKNAPLDNVQLQQAIEQGLDFINMNEMVRSHCRTFLNSIMKEKNMTLQNKCLGLISIKQEDQATELIVEDIESKEDIFFIKDDLRNAVYFYEDGIYVENGRSKIKEITREILGEGYTPVRVNKVIAKIEADKFVDIDKLFNNQNLIEIPVQNGILNLETGELEEFTPKKIFFNKLPVSYNPEATCPNIEKFFKEILKCADDSEVMFEIFGYSLWKEHFIEKAIMLVGNGRNGKGKTLSLLKAFLGAENCCSVPLSQLNPESTGVRELHQKLANLAGDLSNTALKETGLFKEVTGRDTIGAKRKYYRDLNFVNYSKQIFACNELPKVYDLSDGFWERWVLLEFPFKFVPVEQYNLMTDEEKIGKKIQDTDIIHKLTTPEELSGLLNMAIICLKRLRQNKDFSYTTGSKQIKDTWVRKSDSFMAFCFDMIEEDFESSITKKEIRKEFSRYCKIHKLKGAGDKAIKAVLEDLFGVVENRKEIMGKYDNVWEGIKWRKNKC